MHRAHGDFTGRKVGKVTVVRRLPLRMTDSVRKYLCRCECGNECEKSVSVLRTWAATIRCSECYSKAARDAALANGSRPPVRKSKKVEAQMKADSPILGFVEMHTNRFQVAWRQGWNAPADAECPYGMAAIGNRCAWLAAHRDRHGALAA